MQVRPNSWPLTSAQSDIWYAQVLDPQAPDFQEATLIRIHGAVDPIIFEQAMRLLVAEVEAFNTRFMEWDGEPHQVLVEPPHWRMRYVDFSAQTDPEQAMQAWIADDLDQGADFSDENELLFAQTLFRIGPAEFVWYQRVHHIVLDGFGLALILNRLPQIYDALLAGSDAAQGALEGGLWRLSEQEAQYLTSEQYSADAQYWRGRLDGAGPAASLSLRQASSATRSRLTVMAPVPEEIGRQIDTAAESYGVGTSRFLIAAAAAYFHRMSGTHDVVIGMPIGSGTRALQMRTPTMAAKVLPLRLSVGSTSTVEELVHQTAAEVRQAIKHRGIPAGELRRLCAGEHNSSAYTVSVNVIPFAPNLRFGGHPTTAEYPATGPVGDLTFNFYTHGDFGDHRYEVVVEANPKKYTERESWQHAQAFIRMISAVASGAGSVVGDIELTDSAERALVAEAGIGVATQTRANFVLEEFSRQVAADPTMTAIVCGGSQITYGELDAHANALAARLQQGGVGIESVVALAFPRTIELVVAMLATWKLGAAYAVLDPELPIQRKKAIISDVGAQHVVTHPGWDDAIGVDLRILLVDEDTDWSECPKSAQHTLSRSDAEERLGYVIYTSGSTGGPKPTLVPMNGIANTVEWFRNEAELAVGDGVVLALSLSFDGAQKYIWGPLTAGGVVHLAPEGFEPREILQIIDGDNVRAIGLAPSAFELVAESDTDDVLSTLRTVFIGGEPMLQRRVHELREAGVRFVNIYGPTESSDIVCRHTLTAADAEFSSVPIGSPIPNIDMFVLDARMHLVPVGVPGELYLGGIGLARGYGARSGLTAARFVANPLGEPGSRLYRTGDVVRWTDAAELEFIGRADDQVKIRGFRIEPQEIEAVLLQDPALAQAVVIVREDRPGDKQLVAYVVARGGAQVDGGELRTQLRQQLPHYMVPSAVVILEALPFTVNGKLDYRALPVPAMTSGQGPGPRTPEEKLLCEVFAEVLEVPQVSIDDNFFELGGHSLLATRLANRLRAELGCDITIKQIFDAPTPATLLRNGAQTSLPATQAVAGPGIAEAPGMASTNSHVGVEQTQDNLVTAVFPNPVLEDFIEHVVRNPSAIALVCEQSQLSYGELNDRADAVAAALANRSVGVDTVVALLMPRSLELVVGMIAAWKVGAAYSTIDPELPVNRIRNILDDTGAGVVLTRPGIDEGLTADVDTVVVGDDMLNHSAAELVSTAGWDQATLGQRTGYVISTSGTTGRPKPTRVPIRGIANTVGWYRAELGLQAGHRVLVVVSPSFDGAQKEVWAPLTAGATVYLAPERFEPEKILRIIETENVNSVAMTPSPFDVLLDSDSEGVLATLDTVCLGGEPMSQRRLHALREAGVRFLNVYGPTEASDVVARHELAASDAEQDSVPIGVPIPNMDLFVLDSRMRPSPCGVEGELYIAGRGVALGYSGLPGLTASRFVANPWGEPGSRLYRTGDRALRNHAGEFEFLGRADSQVKLRGFRIELREIQTVIQDHPTVAQAAVIVREDRPGDKQLVAYLIASGAGQIDTGALRDHIRRHLPHYMMPAGFIVLDELPLTRNGKVDHRALPAPTVISGRGRGPRNHEEELLCELFAEALGLPQVTIDDDFFELGGHSLMATRLANRVRIELNREISIENIFNTPTPAALLPTLAQSNRIRPALIQRQRDARVPMSYAQQRLHFLSQWGGSTYHIPIVYRLRGQLNHEALAAAIGDLIDRHESLRTVYQEDSNGSVSQVVLPSGARQVPFSWNTVQKSQWSDEIEATVREAFDLASDLPVRVRLLQSGLDDAVLIFVVHHIACDGWSVKPLLRDVSASYNARLQGSTPEWNSLPVQYADYALWQRDSLGEECDPTSPIAEELLWWRQQLAGLPEELPLPYDRRRGKSAGTHGDSVVIEVPVALHAGLLGLASDSSTTLFMVLQAGLTALLSRLTGGHDIPLGTVLAGRNDEALDDLIGFFVNTLVLRADLSGNPTVREFLARIRGVDLDAFEHQQLPFEKLVEALNPPRSIARHPLFQTMMVLQNNAAPTLDMEGLVSDEYIQQFDDSPKFDQLFTWFEQRDSGGAPAGLRCEIHYDADLFNRATIEATGRRLVAVLSAMVADPDQVVDRIEVVGADERNRLLALGGGAGALERTSWQVLPTVFESRVGGGGTAVAVCDGELQLTYGQLNESANRLAHYLIGQGVGPEQRVGLLLDRTADVVVAVLAVLKAGGAYVPLDPTNPHDRIEFILGDSQPKCVITTSKHAGVLPISDVATVRIDDPGVVGQLADLPSTNPTDADRLSRLSPDNIAYIIYTSGSTGRPKGVAVTHRNVLRLFSATEQWFAFGESDVWTLFHSYAFDFSVWELWGPLLYGGRLVVVPFDVSRAPDKFLQLLADEQVTVLNQTPSAFYQLIEADQHAEPALSDRLALRCVVFGGEALDPSRLKRWCHSHPETSLINMYGITETTVHVTYANIGAESVENGVSRVGTPIPDLDIYVLNSALQPVPIGVPGEVYVSGAGLARGYVDRSGLTASRFVADPFGAPGARMYRTGDVVRWTDAAELEYVGRADDQVKIRGFRIEPQEIEAVILRDPAVAQAVVIVREDRPDDKQLVAYVVARGGAQVDGSGLRAQLSQQLPHYMVPSAVVVLEGLPLTVNGKLDYRALPMPAMTSGQGPVPRTPEEKLLCEVFAEVLDVPQVSLDDNFFELGGHSLLATRLANRVRAVLGRDITIKQIFDAPTPATLIQTSSDGGDLLPVMQKLRHGSDDRPALFCIHPGAGISWCYASLTNHLSPGQSLYGIQARGLNDPSSAIATSITEMAVDYLEQIRRIQPVGPYRLLGWSFGGLVAHNIASLLESEGEEVELLALLDIAPAFARGSILPFDAADVIAAGAMEEFANSNAELWQALFPPGGDQASREALLRVATNNVRLLEYRPPVYHGDMVFIAAERTDDGCPRLTAECWTDYVGGHISEHSVDCTHDDMLQPQPSAEIGRILTAALDAGARPRVTSRV